MLNYFKEIVRLTTPIVGARVLYVLINVIGMLFIAQLGEVELAAGALVTSLMTTITVIAMSPLIASTILVSRYHGENKLAEMGTILRTTWCLSLGLATLVCLILWNLAWILALLGQPPELIPLLKNYFYGLIWGTPPLFFLASCHQFCFSIRQGRLVFFWSIIALIFTPLIGWPLVFGIGNFSGFGMTGWAYTMSIANWFMFFFTLLYLYFHKTFQPYQLFTLQKIDITTLKLLGKIGWPITMQFASELLAFAMLNIMVGWLGVGALSVQQILIQCLILSLMIPMSAGQACGILNGQAIGRKETHKIRPITYMGIVFVLLCMSVIALIYFLMPLSIINLYIDITQPNNAALVQLAIVMLGIIAFNQIADAVRNLLIGALRGMHDTQQPLWINLAITWFLALPLGYVLAFPFNQGLIGLHSAFLIAFLIGAVLMLWRFNVKTSEYSIPAIPLNNYN